MTVINLNDKKKLRQAPPLPTHRVRINYLNVKYLEDAPGGKTRVHFIDKTCLLINKPLELVDKQMAAALNKTK